MSPKEQQNIGTEKGTEWERKSLRRREKEEIERKRERRKASEEQGGQREEEKEKEKNIESVQSSQRTLVTSATPQY